MKIFPNIKMPKKYNALDHKYIEKLARIRKDNVQRHAGYENTLKLRENIKRQQRNLTYDMEFQRLNSGTAQGHLAAHAHKRKEELRKILGK